MTILDLKRTPISSALRIIFFHIFAASLLVQLTLPGLPGYATSMKETDIRWHQRFENFHQAFIQLQEAYSLSVQRSLSDLENQGVIQAFEYTHELAWNVIKDYFQDQGNNQITGSKDATRLAFQMGLVQNGHIWMEMIKSRNQTSHTYNKSLSQDILKKILGEYYLEFSNFDKRMAELKEKQNG